MTLQRMSLAGFPEVATARASAPEAQMPTRCTRSASAHVTAMGRLDPQFFFFSKIKGTSLVNPRVRIIRIIVHWGLHRGPSKLGNDQRQMDGHPMCWAFLSSNHHPFTMGLNFTRIALGAKLHAAVNQAALQHDRLHGHHVSESWSSSS